MTLVQARPVRRFGRLLAGTFYLQLASEPDPARVLEIVRDHSRDDQRIFVGVTDPTLVPFAWPTIATDSFTVAIDNSKCRMGDVAEASDRGCVKVAKAGWVTVTV